jgi:energy-coupling factor transporter ATP-binding protein EcfA2
MTKKKRANNKPRGKNKDITKFIDYLDTYKNQKDMNIDTMMNIVNNINVDFYKNRYYQPEYVGDVYSGTQNQVGNYYNLYGNNNKFFYTSGIEVAQKHPFFYENGGNYGDNEKITTISPPPSSPTFKNKIEINDTVSQISDLLSIIQKYDYDENTEYNIDLKALKKIKDELIELESMIGMKELKTSILTQLLYFIQEMHITKLSNKTIHEYKHTVICGPPGTGKTDVAKIIGRIYSKIGILNKNIFKKVTRGDLVAEYLGQTAVKTKKVINECLGGVLFIDEAYSLSNGVNDLDSFSKECIDTLCECLSDHKEDLMVIIAGYENELNNYFFKANTGLESRFIWRFKIDTYNSNELREIFNKKVAEIGWVLADDIEKGWFEKNQKSFDFFGRSMELLLTYTKIAHSKRVYGKSMDCKRIITQKDLDDGFIVYMNNRKKDENSRTFEYLYV